MKDELQQQLYDRYPKIFAQRTLPITESCMAWGIEAGDGWFMLLDALCRFLQYDTDHNGYPQVVATQVKEKFGGLSFYTEGADVRQDTAISFAEALSYRICEVCGSTQDVQQTGGWIRTLCGACRSKDGKPAKEPAPA